MYHLNPHATQKMYYVYSSQGALFPCGPVSHSTLPLNANILLQDNTQSSAHKNENL